MSSMVAVIYKGVRLPEVCGSGVERERDKHHSLVKGLFSLIFDEKNQSELDREVSVVCEPSWWESI